MRAAVTTLRRYRPWHALLYGLLLAAFAAAITVPTARAAHRSTQTQHGTPISGRVVDADTDWHGTQRDTSIYRVREPDGALVTVQAPGRADLALIGTSMLIVVDPRDPTYGELPGHPLQTWRSVWITDAIFGGLALAVWGLGLSGYRTERKQRRHRPKAGASTAM